LENASVLGPRAQHVYAEIQPQPRRPRSLPARSRESSVVPVEIDHMQRTIERLTNELIQLRSERSRDHPVITRRRSPHTPVPALESLQAAAAALGESQPNVGGDIPGGERGDNEPPPQQQNDQQPPPPGQNANAAGGAGGNAGRGGRENDDEF
jgi:hypothetical protein